MVPDKDTGSLLEMFRGLSILVAGDLVLDHYMEGSVSRISPEAPVPVVTLGDQCERWIPGGAANVALNVLSLGGIPFMAGVVGDDSQGERLRLLLHNAGVDVSAVVTDPGRPTTVKTRIMGRNQQLMRVDRESTADLDKDTGKQLMEAVAPLRDGVCSYILEDYNKGVLCEETIRMITDMAGRSCRPVAVDPKIVNFWNYGGCTLFKPNRHEAGTALGMEIGNIDQASEAASLICRRMPADNVLITLGSMGSVLYQGSSGTSRHIPTVARHVFDVSGAGDSVIAVMGLAQGCGMDVYDAARLANLAAAAVCIEPGVYAVKPHDIIREAERFEHGS